MTDIATDPPSYWFSDSAEDDRGARVMEALRAYRAAEMSMRRRTQASMSMGENEMLVLRFLTRHGRRSRDVTPIDLARYLGISTASMTALLDRLERSGHLERRPHPSDRRKVLVAATPHTEDEMREVLGSMHAQMMLATHGMTEAETTAVTRFLERMRTAVDGVGTGPASNPPATAIPDVAA
ncbi:transcriptional regulator [Microbacterium testaceum StLB037]|uniref:Transcriptional regulator n=1 Tax=Microbacterium testaceum (strain StLB037) TaxID=979556 RepID=E8NEG1_MICTS|nr:MarR family transcriptional regulator [Microbacterium testaceum]BAJ73827.1 transcriptional regulator [Microbacterium testaceum StLB037]